MCAHQSRMPATKEWSKNIALTRPATPTVNKVERIKVSVTCCWKMMHLCIRSVPTCSSTLISNSYDSGLQQLNGTLQDEIDLWGHPRCTIQRQEVNRDQVSRILQPDPTCCHFSGAHSGMSHTLLMLHYWYSLRLNSAFPNGNLGYMYQLHSMRWVFPNDSRLMWKGYMVGVMERQESCSISVLNYSNVHCKSSIILYIMNWLGIQYLTDKTLDALSLKRPAISHMMHCVVPETS